MAKDIKIMQSNLKLSCIKVEGDGAKALLQGQLTCNLLDSSPGKPLLGAHCNPQGRVISLFRLHQVANAYYLEMPCTLIPIALTALKKYAIFFKVTLSESPAPFETDPTWRHTRIINCLPTIYPETSEKFLPHELNLPALQAVSFNKGCYTGQEIIARMHYRGKMTIMLTCAKVETDSPPLLGTDIYHETGVAGAIVDFCKTDPNRYTVLISIKPCDLLFLDAERNIILQLI